MKLGIKHNEVRSLETSQSSCISVSFIVLHFQGRTVEWCMVIYDQCLATEKHPSWNEC